MLCVSILGPSLNDVENQIKEALFADILEFRIDHFHDEVWEHLKELTERVSLPVIFTYRKRNFEKLIELGSFSPDYMDIEWDMPKRFFKKLKKRFLKIQWIISYHHFEKTPNNLDLLLKRMKRLEGNFYKIACLAKKDTDPLKLIVFAEKHPEVLAVSMGRKGEISRIFNPSFITYAPLHKNPQLAGGVTADSKKKDDFYALLGDVEKSFSHQVHNFIMKDLNGFYFTVCLSKKGLKSFFDLSFPFSGLSVTIPLKEKILPFLDFIDEDAKKIKAVNTVVYKEGKTIGYNTDGKAALDLLEEKTNLKGKKIVVLGAGGAARAIIYEAVKRKADVAVLNRTRSKADRLSEEFQIPSGSLEDIDLYPYDIIVNATASSDPLFFKKRINGEIAMDIHLFKKMTPFLKKADKAILIYGYEMWIKQAVSQYKLWFFGIDSEKIEKDMLKTFKKIY